jgi:WD40 repeat protein
MLLNRFGQHLAVVIGINDYHSGVPGLQTPVNDAQALAALLADQHGYEVMLWLNDQANRGALVELLEQDLPKRLGENDRLLFYFAGHGIALNGDDGPEGYLIPQDAKLGDVSTYLPMSLVNRALLKLPCRHFLGILDCCFAGAFRWSSTRKLVVLEQGTIHKQRFDRFVLDPAWQMITSAASDQSALDAFDLKSRNRGMRGDHSPFAAALINALQGQADTFPAAEPGKPAGDGVLTASELYIYLREMIEPETEAQNLRQTPGIFPLSKHDKGEYIFLTPGHILNLPDAPPLDASRNPYRGLESFDEAHKDLFWGRQALTQKLTEFVTTHALTVVLGASGSGKSSLVKAGLVPQLRQQGWAVLPPLRPGESPFKALNQVLESVKLSPVTPSMSGNSSGLLTSTQSLDFWFREHPQTHLLVVIDQFEELLTLCRDPQERQKFLQALAEGIARYPQQLHLVLTLRSDFEAQFRNTTLEPEWQAARFIVPAMTREELRQAVEEPASARVMYFEPHELVEQLIDEVANMPGALPLLSFALSELYLNYLKRQEAAKLRGETIDRAMTQVDYEQMGGVTRSLTQRAEQEYETLVQVDPAYKHTIRNVMLRMVSVGGELARRRVPLSELVYPEPENGRVQEAVKRFAEARLLTAGRDNEDQPYQEPAHDALIRGWGRLLGWKQTELGNLVLQRELYPRAERWQKEKLNKQSLGLLWNADPRLPQLLKLLKEGNGWLNQTEIEFVKRSYQRKINNQRRLLGSLSAIILALSGLTVYAFRQATIAQLREQSVRAQNILSTNNKAAGVILAIDAMNRSQSLPEIENTASSVLMAAIQLSPEVNLLQDSEDSVESVAFNSKGKFIVSGSSDGKLRFWDSQTGQLIGVPVRGHKDSVQSIAISPDGKLIVSGSSDGTVGFWNTQSRQLMGKPLQGHENSVNSIVISPDGKYIISGSGDGTVRLWNVQTREPFGKPLQGHAVNSVAISPNGKYIVSGGSDGTIRLWDVQTRQLIGEPLRGHRDSVASVAFSPDGQSFASGGHDFMVLLWDLQTGQQIRRFQGHKGDVTSVAFSFDGKQIVSGSRDRMLRQWDVGTGQSIVQPLQGHGDAVNSIAISPEGKYIISGGRDGTIRLWDSQTVQPLGQLLLGHRDSVNSVAFSFDGKRIVSGSGNALDSKDNTLRLWDVQTGRSVGQPFQGHTDQVKSVSFSPDGKQIFSGAADNTIRVWDSQTGQLIGEPLRGHTASVKSIAISPDGKLIVSGSIDGTVRFWDTQTRQPFGQPLQVNDSWITSVSFSPDGNRVVSGGTDGVVRFWDVQTRQLIGKPLQVNRYSILSVKFSSDGRYFISGGSDYVLRLWNIYPAQLIGQPFRGHEALVNSVAFSPDARSVVSGSGTGDLFNSDDLDNTVRLWDIRTGQLIGQPFRGHMAPVWSVAFSPDGKHVVSGSYDGTVRLWDISPDTLLSTACNRLQYHPLLNQPETHTSDPEFIQVARRAKAACQRRV